jgi:hypothetical protein
VENGINKWIRLYRRLEKAKQKARQENRAEPQNLLAFMSKKEIAKVKGTKFPSGSGTSGREGQKRYHRLKIFISENFYESNERATNNKKELEGRLMKLVREAEARNSNGEKSRTHNEEEEAEDILMEECSKVAEMQNSEWDAIFGQSAVTNTRNFSI